MKTSESIAELAKALPALQADMKELKKDKEGYNYKYADLTQVIEMARPVLKKHGFAILHPPNDYQMDHYIETILVHESGQWIGSSIKLELSKEDMQGLGSAQTYARRYGTLSMLFISADDDDDAESISLATPKQMAMIKGKAFSAGIKNPVQFEEMVQSAIGKPSNKILKSDVDEIVKFIETGEIN